MKLRPLIALILGLAGSNFSYAVTTVEPIINKNVHVLKGVSASQCPASWNGNPGTADIEVDSAEGINNSGVASGVRSCTGCALDQASGDCVCNTCYDNYN